MSDPIEMFLYGVIVSGLFAFLLAAGCTAKVYERDAIKAGVAEYYLDANHSKQFRYKTNGVSITECKCN